MAHKPHGTDLFHTGPSTGRVFEKLTQGTESAILNWLADSREAPCNSAAVAATVIAFCL